MSYQLARIAEECGVSVAKGNIGLMAYSGLRVDGHKGPQDCWFVETPINKYVLKGLCIFVPFIHDIYGG